jgi:hypothetical protein
VPYERIEPVGPDRSVAAVPPAVLTPVEREQERERRERARRERKRREGAPAPTPEPGADRPRIDLRA